MSLLATSQLYESEPFYVLTQPQFLNGVCLLETTLSPEVLLEGLNIPHPLIQEREKISQKSKTSNRDV
jgi:7,8-dihydro-6-hydroxymethylpterin-pyrophosphokinase